MGSPRCRGGGSVFLLKVPGKGRSPGADGAGRVSAANRGIWGGGGVDIFSGAEMSTKFFFSRKAFARKPCATIICGCRKRGLLEKGSFQKSPVSRDFRDSREPSECGKQRRIRPFSRDCREASIQ